MAEYHSLYTAIQDVIPLIKILDQFQYRDHNMISTEPNIYCKTIEYNSSALKTAHLPMMITHTKVINVVTITSEDMFSLDSS